METTMLNEVLDAIPEGRWISYADLAIAAGGNKGHARTLNARLTRDDHPHAHRVLRIDGGIGPTALGDPAAVRTRLEAEGVTFGVEGCAPAEQRWRP